MSEIECAVSADGNGYAALQGRLAAFQRMADALQERAEKVRARMRRNAGAVERLADLCAAAEVDDRRTATIGELSAAFGHVAMGAQGIISAADSMSHAAGHLRAEHAAEYGGIHEAVSAAPGRQAKPGFYRQT